MNTQDSVYMFLLMLLGIGGFFIFISLITLAAMGALPNQMRSKFLEMKKDLIDSALRNKCDLTQLHTLLDNLEKEEKEKYESVRWTPSHIFWTILTGVVSAALGGIVLYLLTQGK